MKNPKTLLLLLLFFFFCLSSSHSKNPKEDQQLHQSSSYWLNNKMKTLFNHAQSYLFPPNLDFRGSISSKDDEGGVIEEDGEGGLKEAVAKSLSKGTATVEESAKSAAHKLKQTLSSSHHQDL